MPNRRTPTQHLGLPILNHLLNPIIHTLHHAPARIHRLPNAPDSHGRDLVVRIIESLGSLRKTRETRDVKIAIRIGRDIIKRHADMDGVKETKRLIGLESEDADLAVYGAGDIEEAVTAAG